MLNKIEDHLIRHDLIHTVTDVPALLDESSIFTGTDRWDRNGRKVTNLLRDYDKVTLGETCEAVKFAKEYFDEEYLKEIDWVSTFLKKCCAPKLRSLVDAELDRLRGEDPSWVGAPVTLKIILANVINCSEKALKDLPKKIAKIEIKDIQGEHIPDLTNRLTYAIKRIRQAGLKVVLESDLIAMFQTTSNETFNKGFAFLQSSLDMGMISDTPSYVEIFAKANTLYYNEVNEGNWLVVKEDLASVFPANDKLDSKDTDERKLKRPPICQRPNPSSDEKKMIDGNKCWSRKSKKGEWMQWCGKCFWKEGSNAFDGRWTTGEFKHFTHEHRSKNERAAANLADIPQDIPEDDKSDQEPAEPVSFTDRLKSFRDAAANAGK